MHYEIRTMTRTGWRFVPLLRAVILASAIAIAPSGWAQDDDDPPDLNARPQPMAQFPDDVVEQWIFNGSPNGIEARKNIETLLTLQVEDVDRCCVLSDVQKKKLHLAGRGDIVRFFDRVAQIKQKFLAIKNDQNKVNEIFQEIQPLQMTLQSGLFNDSSFLHKAIRKTLNAEQAQKYDKVAQDRRTFRYRAKIELVVAMLENGLPLRDDQRQQVVKLLQEETQPPKKFGQYDYYVIMLQMSKLPEEKLKPIFDDAQWRLLGRQFVQVKGMEPFLKNGEFIPVADPVVEGGDIDLGVDVIPPPDAKE